MQSLKTFLLINIRTPGFYLESHWMFFLGVYSVAPGNTHNKQSNSQSLKMTSTFFSSSSYFFFFYTGHQEGRKSCIPVCSTSPWILEGMCSWSGFILWAGGGEASQSPNYTNWDNQMTSLIHPWEEPASTQNFLTETGWKVKLQTSDVRL